MIKLYSCVRPVSKAASWGTKLKCPRTKATVFRRIMNRSRVRRSKPKRCDYCDEYAAAKKEWDSTLARLDSTNDPDEKKRFLTKLEGLKVTMDVGRLHQARDHHQQQKVTQLRLNMLEGECIWWRDFGSWGRPGARCNDLTIVIEFMEGGFLTREFVDFPSEDSSHDVHFLAQCMTYLFEKTTHVILHNEDGPGPVVSPKSTLWAITATPS
jgi:hypothetical protein